MGIDEEVTGQQRGELALDLGRAEARHRHLVEEGEGDGARGLDGGRAREVGVAEDGDLEDVTSDEHAEVSALLVRSLHALKEASGPDGFNVGVNLGRVAGAGVLGHVHWHVVPRWNGDTNFMAVLGEARVLPEALAATYAKLGPLLKKS